MARALLISPEAPYPLQGGGAMRTASILHYLAQRHQVDLVLFTPDAAMRLPAGLAQETLTVPLTPHSKSAAARIWRNTGRLVRGVSPLNDRFSGYSNLIGTWLANRTYDVAVFEHFWTVSYLPLVRPRAKRVVLDLHNIESVWHERCAAVESGPKRVAFRRFAQVCRRAELRWLPGFDGILVPSAEDGKSISCPAFVYPNALPLWAVPPVESDQLSIVFSGNWEYGPNQIGLAWFLRSVWPSIRSKFEGVVLRLVGRSPESIRRMIANSPNVEITGPVDDALSWIAKSQVAIVPILAGSGTRVKILEAWAASVPVVSTRLGAEGLNVIDRQTACLADSPTEFGQAVIELLEDIPKARLIGEQGRKHYEERFSWPAAWDTLSRTGFL